MKMTSLLKNSYFKYNPDTVESVRKEYNLHKSGAMDQAIDVLNDWIHKQDHLIKKDLPREYLERFIIAAKGSVEIAKTRIDKLYTMQSIVPILFEKRHVKKDFPNLRNFFLTVFLPNLTEDNCRIHIGKLMTKNITATACLESYQHCRILFEYGKMYDYAKGYYIIYDLKDVNVMDTISNVDWVQFRSIISLTIDAYGYRVAGIYVISDSKMINTLVQLIKTMLSEKIAGRIQVLKNMESLYDFFPKESLPQDFGGGLKSTLDLYDEMNEALCSEEFIAHLEAMKHARTNEEFRRKESFNSEYLGMPGSFKMLSVD